MWDSVGSLFVRAKPECEELTGSYSPSNRIWMDIHLLGKDINRVPDFRFFVFVHVPIVS